MRPDEYDEPQQVSGHYGMCPEPGHPSACPRCAERWAEEWPDEDEPLMPMAAGRSRIVLLLDTPADMERPTRAEIERGVEL